MSKKAKKKTLSIYHIQQKYLLYDQIESHCVFFFLEKETFMKCLLTNLQFIQYKST